MSIKFDTFTGAGGGAGTDTLDDVTGRGATTTNAITVGGLSIGTAYTMPTADGSANQVLSTDGSGSISFSTLNITGGLEYKGDYTGQSLVTAEKGDFYVVNGSQTLAGVSLNNNDHIVFSSDAADPVTTAMFDVIDNTDAVSSVNGQTGPVSLGVGDLSDVTITGAANGEVLKYNGSAWVDAQVAYSEVSGTPTNISTFTNDSGYLTNINSENLGDLSDVTITGAANGEVLKYNGSAWVDATLAYSELSGTPTNVSTFTNDSGYLTNINSESINDLSDVTITSATNGQVISYNGSAWVNSAASAGSLAGLSDTTIGTPTNGEVLKYDGSSWVDATLAYSELSGTPTNISTFTNDSGYLTAITGQSIGSLSDVTITAAASGEYLRYNGSAWVDAALGIVDDTTPSLGGNLDVSGNDIVSASNGAIEIAPDGTGSVIIKGNTAASATNTGHIKLNCENNSHYVRISSPAHSAYTGGSYNLIFPASVGTAGQVLKTDGGDSGSPNNVQLSWVDQSAGGGGYTYSAITADPANAQANYHYSCTGTFTITLPTSGISAGAEIRVKNMGTGTITIDPQSQEIDGDSADYILDVRYSAVTLVSTGTHWEVI